MSDFLHNLRLLLLQSFGNINQLLKFRRKNSWLFLPTRKKGPKFETQSYHVWKRQIKACELKWSVKTNRQQLRGENSDNNKTKMVSAQLVLKVYSLMLGGAVSFLAFLWVAFELYVVSQTAPDQVMTSLYVLLHLLINTV